MALLQDLIQQIDDPTLKERILQETNKLLKQKKFGLVFEEHLPECTPLYDVPIRVGSKVARKTGYVSDIYIVMKIDGDEVQCDRRETHEQTTFKLDELVTVAEFGEPIYPTLWQRICGRLWRFRLPRFLVCRRKRRRGGARETCQSQGRHRQRAGGVCGKEGFV